MDDQQFNRLIEVLLLIGGELERIANYIGDSPNADSEIEAFKSLKRIAEAVERGN